MADQPRPWFRQETDEGVNKPLGLQPKDVLHIVRPSNAVPEAQVLPPIRYTPREEPPFLKPSALAVAVLVSGRLLFALDR